MQAGICELERWYVHAALERAVRTAADAPSRVPRHPSTRVWGRRGCLAGWLAASHSNNHDNTEAFIAKELLNHGRGRCRR